ncbi:MAG: hypothetical protein HZA78_04200 [Candidatus Schekmanbacteria bacterium]|nr:hypothetical protein [Candidatus Schekmanbacteria bacterium]
MANQAASDRIIQTKHLLLLLAWASLLHFPFIYRYGASEGDSYVLVNGIIDAVNRGDFMRNQLLVFDFYSFGYYWLIFKLQPLLALTSAQIFPLVNHLAFLCSVLVTIPMYLFLKEMLSARIAFYTLIAYHLAPSVFDVSGYGHPASAACLVMWVAIYLFYRSLKHLEQKKTLAYLDLISASVFCVLAMALRTDVFFLLWPFLLGTLYYKNFWQRRHLFHFAIFSVACFVLFSLLQYAAIGVTWNDFSPIHFFTELNKFHVTGNWLQRVARPLITLALAVGPLMALMALISCFYLYRRQRRVFIFLAAWVIPIVLFWLPYPTPARHSLYVFPGIVTAVICLLDGIGKRYFPWLVAIFMALNYFSPLLFYRAIISSHEQKGLPAGQKQVSFNAPLLPAMENHYYMQKEIDGYQRQAQILAAIHDKSVIYIDNFEQLAVHALITSKPGYYWSGRIYFDARDGFIYNQISTPQNQYLLVTAPTGSRPQDALKKFTPQEEYAPYYIAVFPDTLRKYPQLKIPQGYRRLDLAG